MYLFAAQRRRYFEGLLWERRKRPDCVRDLSNSDQGPRRQTSSSYSGWRRRRAAGMSAKVIVLTNGSFMACHIGQQALTEQREGVGLVVPKGRWYCNQGTSPVFGSKCLIGRVELVKQSDGRLRNGKQHHSRGYRILFMLKVPSRLTIYPTADFGD